MVFSTHPRLAPRSRRCRATTLFKPCVFKACCRERLPHRLLGHAVTLVVGLSARRPKIHLKPVNMGSDVEKLKLGAFLFHVIRFTRVGAIPLTYHMCPFAGLSLRSRRIDTKPVRMRFLVKKNDPGTCFSPMASVFRCQYHPTNVPYSYFIHPPQMLRRLGN